MTTACEDEGSAPVFVDVGKITDVGNLVDPDVIELERTFREVELVSTELVRGNVELITSTDEETMELDTVELAAELVTLVDMELDRD